MSQNQIPAQMKAMVLEKYGDIRSLRVVERPVPKPGPNEVLVRVAASPINPSDLAFLEGRYGFNKPAPVIPGIEGSGTVVAAGSGLMGRYLLGKRVACVSSANGDGLWAEYLLTTANSAYPLDDAVELEQGAMSLANPLSALAFMEIARQGGHKTIVNTAAASALGQMLERLAQNEGILVINVVRRPEQAELLKQLGAQVALNSSDTDFDAQLKEVCHRHQARLAFDAVAGKMTLQLLEALPHNGKVTVYGGLSMQPSEVWASQFIFEGKSVDGFWLTTWIPKKNFLQSLLFWQKAQKLMNSSLKTHIRARYPLQEAQKAVMDYQQKMTGGKVLLTTRE
jgi:NADPH:quinone reductase-like Zn-dependent oxidoreductase